MNIVIYNNKQHTTDLIIGDLAFNPNTTPIKYYIVDDINYIDNQIYYIVRDTRFARKRPVRKNILIKLYNPQCT